LLCEDLTPPRAGRHGRPARRRHLRHDDRQDRTFVPRTTPLGRPANLEQRSDPL